MSDSCGPFLASLVSLRTGVRVDKEDIAFSEIKKLTEERKSAFVRCILEHLLCDVFLTITIFSRNNNVFLPSCVTSIFDISSDGLKHISYFNFMLNRYDKL